MSLKLPFEGEKLPGAGPLVENHWGKKLPRLFDQTERPGNAGTLSLFGKQLPICPPRFELWRTGRTVSFHNFNRKISN